MSKNIVTKLIDTSFISLCIFLLLFAWINFYIRNIKLTFLVSIMLTISIIYIVYSYAEKKHTSKQNLINAKIEIDRCFNSFLSMPNNRRLSLIESILSKEHVTTKNNNAIYYNEQENRSALKVVTSHIDSIDDLLIAISELNQPNVDTIQLVCTYPTNVDTNILSNKKIEIIDKTKLYSQFFLKYQIFPDTNNLVIPNDKVKLKDVIKKIFDNKKSKGYLFAGTILIFSSVLVPFKLYYLLVGSTLLIFALASKILPKTLQHRSQ